MTQPPEILSVDEARVRVPLVLALTGCSRATLYRRIKDGLWPAPMQDGPRCVYWPARVVREALKA